MTTPEAPITTEPTAPLSSVIEAILRETSLLGRTGHIAPIVDRITQHVAARLDRHDLEAAQHQAAAAARAEHLREVLAAAVELHIPCPDHPRGAAAFITARRHPKNGRWQISDGAHDVWTGRRWLPAITLPPDVAWRYTTPTEAYAAADAAAAAETARFNAHMYEIPEGHARRHQEDDETYGEWVAAQIGPRQVGGHYRSGGDEYEVVALDPGPRQGAWPIWQITVRGEDGIERSHCTAWDKYNDQVITQPAPTEGAS
jgi:hypothetical protein